MKTLDYSEYFDEENAQRLAVMIAEQLIDFDSFKMDCVDVETKFGTLGVVQVSEDETVDDEDDEEPGEVIETQFTLREGGTDSDDEDGNFL